MLRRSEGVFGCRPCSPIVKSILRGVRCHEGSAEQRRAHSCSSSMMRVVHPLAETRYLRLHGVSGKQGRRSEMDWRFSGIKGDR